MLNFEEKASVLYHNLFDYPLNLPDLIKWKAGKQLPTTNFQLPVTNKNGYFYLEGREGLIYKRLLRKRISAKKNKIAQKASHVLSFIPGVKMVAITGSLAMENSSEESDIDLMIITRKGALWTTRAFTYMVIHAFGLAARKPNDLRQKDKLCLNMWLDESDLVWPKKDRNLYTAHEIAQIVPLVNKNKTYEKFLFQNKWILGYWPHSVKIENYKLKIVNSRVGLGLLELIAYKIQLNHMRSRITREVITPTRAIFHPQDWGKVVLKKMKIVQ
jgi:D-beta-D-heptose 7-phosphate kinase/D-beta-D-heptose 1-phosphate adenosyltransferase